MRIRYTLLALPILLLALGCSDESSDPLAEACAKACKISDQHPCYDNGKGETECTNKCRIFVGAVDKNADYLPGCAKCLAGLYSYAVKPDAPCSETNPDPSCCYPGYVIQPKEDDPACAAACLEPDGGVGY